MDQATESILSGQPTSIATAPAAAPAPVIPARSPGSTNFRNSRPGTRQARSPRIPAKQEPRPQHP